MSKLNLIAYPLVAIVSLIAAGSALAERGDVTVDNSAAVPSLKSREQVQAELMQARADGSIKAWSFTYNPLALTKSQASRAEVRAARSLAFDRAYYGEDSGSFAMSRQQPARVAPALYAGVTTK